MQHKNLFRKLDRNLRKIERSSDLLATTSEILRRLVDDFRDDLGLVGGRIYAREDAHYVLQREYPQGRARLGFRIPVTYPVIQELLAQGYVYRGSGDPDVDHEIERAIGVEVFAAIGVGDGGEQIIAFSLGEDADPDSVVHTLNTIRNVINLKLRHEWLEDRVAEARAIQMSLLPKAPPVFGDYDFWGATVPAEEVGGDLYDFIPVSKRSLGLAIADASGHGLPAALQARDAIIGLRMGVAESLRITATLEKLNRVVGASALASKFISLFYGELERNGTLVYCNAGHTPPLIWNGSAFDELSRGGMVLGPNPDAVYERHYTTLGPGAVFLAYTDGITEAENAAGEAFGVERVKALVRRPGWKSARDLVEAVFEAVRSFSGQAAPDDDQTVIAILGPGTRSGA
jgi:sigma-B regulation protein RsbU (phosphoserine phosphatase)